MMEVKTLLRLIKDDIAHLNGITDDFFTESLLLSDEVELALVRAKALLRELELLQKFTDQHENGSKVVRMDEEPKEILRPDLMDLVPDEEDQLTSLAVTAKPDSIELPEISYDISPVEVHLADSEYIVPTTAIFNEEESENNLKATDVTDEVIDENPNILIETLQVAEVDLEIPIGAETVFAETKVLTDNPDHKEEIIAEEFAEVKKTLNETLGDAHQMVNDILSPEKSESGYRILPINSIWEGIGINDRFLYIRELFANSSAKFETTIAALDKLSTINEAVNYLKMNFKWPKSEASQKFLVLIKRRFIK